MGIPPPGAWGTATGRFPLKTTLPLPSQCLLCTEIERVGRRVWICKLFHRQHNVRHPVFQRVTVEGNRTEAQRVMAALYELQKIKEEG